MNTHVYTVHLFIQKKKNLKKKNEIDFDGSPSVGLTTMGMNMTVSLNTNGVGLDSTLTPSVTASSNLINIAAITAASPTAAAAASPAAGAVASAMTTTICTATSNNNSAATAAAAAATTTFLATSPVGVAANGPSARIDL